MAAPLITHEATESLPLFELARRRGHAAADACSSKAERTSAFDAAAAKAEVLAVLSASARPMTGEELVDHCQRVGLVPHDPRAFGGVFLALSRRGQIKAVGFAPRRKGHGTAGARLWEATDGR